MNQAAQNLGNFFIRRLAMIQEVSDLKISLKDAPMTSLEELTKNYYEKNELIIHSGNLESPMGLTGNRAFRVLHDLVHIQLQLGFDTKSELAVHLELLTIVDEEFGTGSTESLFYLIDTVLQTLYYAEHGDYVGNQYAFHDVYKHCYRMPLDPCKYILQLALDRLNQTN